MPSSVFPAWIVKTPEGLQLDKAKAQLLHRIRKLLPKMGLEAIAKLLNNEGVSPLNTRKRPGRKVPLWDKTTIQKIIRGRQVLGEQAVGRYLDVKDTRTGEVTFKRVLTGEVVKNAYPAVFTEDEWLAANHAIDSRKRGAQTGRNVTRFTNLFGDLARCSRCGGRMKVRGKSGHGEIKYLGCSNAGVHGCNHGEYYRLDKLEAEVFAMLGSLKWSDEHSTEEVVNSLEAQHAIAKREADKLQRNLDEMAASFADAPSAIKASMLKLAAQHAEKQEIVTTLERRLAAVRSVKLADDLADAQTLTQRLARLRGARLVKARGEIAGLLQSLFREILFGGDVIYVTLADGGTYRLGEWVAAGGVPFKPSVSHGRRKRWDSSVWSNVDDGVKKLWQPDPTEAGRRSKRALAEFDAQKKRRK